jgi:mono/diheme cytochrome c family protein
VRDSLQRSTSSLQRLTFPAAALLSAAAATLLAHDPITTKVTWDREIQPIVQARCVSCHSPGGRAPMSLTTYAEARPWARAIREEVLTRRMPIWHVARGYGDFTNDPSLSPFEIALIVAWVDGGSPAFAKASTSALRATADKSTSALAAGSDRSAGKPSIAEAPKGKQGSSITTAPREAAPPGRKPAPAVARNVTIPCVSRTLPAGRLVGLRPLLEDGASLQLTMAGADGTEEPLLWIRNFDPDFAETYWLRTPLAPAPGSRIIVSPEGTDGTCSVTLFFG